MSDRELLEKAAKAAKLKVGPHPSAGGSLWDESDPSNHKLWNPLQDDGDALRLFCALPWLSIETSDLAATVLERGKPDEPRRVYRMWTEWLDRHNGDLAAATRLAIVRAAAALADPIPSQGGQP